MDPDVRILTKKVKKNVEFDYSKIDLSTVYQSGISQVLYVEAEPENILGACLLYTFYAADDMHCVELVYFCSITHNTLLTPLCNVM